MEVPQYQKLDDDVEEQAREEESVVYWDNFKQLCSDILLIIALFLGCLSVLFVVYGVFDLVKTNEKLTQDLDDLYFFIDNELGDLYRERLEYNLDFDELYDWY